MNLPFIYALPWAAALIILFASATRDLKDRIIPNEYVVIVAAIGVAQCIATRPGLAWVSLLAAAGTLIGLGFLAHWNLIGGGDVKMISAVTLLVPPNQAPVLLIDIALAGGVLSCMYLAAHHAFRGITVSQAAEAGFAPPVSRLARLVKTEHARIAAGDSLPYALAILGGVIAYMAREFI
ncbi:A24 family peptidase [Methylocella silvestris]|uniref:Prepilin peptidase n=1 Tax=Methylocella silvestris TaxID=199596 RepID=A0A2J7TK54_METSI|nr:prepilin peptidase [Methylocella silvestris]PNG27143.1 prepilin peptidase [Methylocella silvestris]